jgi:hypothetical protein
VVLAGSTHTISGRLFNGFSEGASYGDDAAMSTNYPLVRIRNIATGHVCYARTYDHASMGIELISSTVVTSTTFTVPVSCCIESGPSELFVVVNGIPSLRVIINDTPTFTLTFSVIKPGTCTSTVGKGGKGKGGMGCSSDAIGEAVGSAFGASAGYVFS